MCLGSRLVTRRANLPLVATLLRGMDSTSVHQVIASDINTGLIHTFSNSTLHQLMQSTAIANGLIRGSRRYIQNRRGEIRALLTIQHDMSMSAALNQSLDAVSVEKYLTYNNPHITSFANHNFVSSALSTARACDILPNSRAKADFFAASTLPSSNPLFSSLAHFDGFFNPRFHTVSS
jgi:hypothetical protein